MTYNGSKQLIPYTSYQSIFPFGTVQTAEAKFNLTLASGDTVQSATISIVVEIDGPRLNEVVSTILFNGNTHGNLDFPGFQTGNVSKNLTIDIKDQLKSTDNDLVIKLDSLYTDATWHVSAIMNYVTNSKPVDDTVHNPDGSGGGGNSFLQWFDFLKNPFGSTTNTIKTVGLVAGVGLVAYLLFRGARSSPVIVLGNRLRGK